jgi:nitrogen-specific signal transduction histidine kinase
VIELAVHQGLDATLTVLGRRTNRAQITVQRDYAPELPGITAFGAELNQVCVEETARERGARRGTGRNRHIVTRVVDGCVEVDVIDGGPGISAAIRDRIFDPVSPPATLARAPA